MHRIYFHTSLQINVKTKLIGLFLRGGGTSYHHKMIEYSQYYHNLNQYPGLDLNSYIAGNINGHFFRNESYPVKLIISQTDQFGRQTIYYYYLIVGDLPVCVQKILSTFAWCLCLCLPYKLLQY